MEDSKESRLRAEFFVRLADSDWVNIVNHPDVLDRPDGDTEMAVACAVRLTEHRLRELNAAASASRSEILEALEEILSIEPMSPEGGHEAVAEIHRVARAALAKYQGE